MSDNPEGRDRRGVIRMLGAATVGALLGVGTVQGVGAELGARAAHVPGGQPVVLYGADGNPLPQFTQADPGRIALMGSPSGVEANTDAHGNLDVTLGTTLSSDLDSIDVARQSKGGVTVAHEAITATAASEEVDCRGFNALLVEVTTSAISVGSWEVGVLGTLTSGGAAGPCFDVRSGNPSPMTSGAVTTNGVALYVFKGIPDYVRIVATRAQDGALTCRVQPVNL